MKAFLVFNAFLAGATAILSGQALSTQEIQNAKRYDEHGDPKFSVIDAASVSRAVHVAAGRSYAVFGYNTPAVIVELPASDNSAYAVVEFRDASPLGKDGKPLPHEIERGLYDAAAHATEIRFVSPAGGKDLVPLARARGRVAIRYPLEVRTTVVKGGSAEAARLGIEVAAESRAGPEVASRSRPIGPLEIDGPYVKYRPDELALPEAAAFTGIEPLRAYDASGKRLERYNGVQKSDFANGVSTRTIAFWGPVASVRYDTIVRWTALEIPFDLPAAPMRPAGREGTP